MEVFTNMQQPAAQVPFLPRTEEYGSSEGSQTRFQASGTRKETNTEHVFCTEITLQRETMALSGSLYQE